MIDEFTQLDLYEKLLQLRDCEIANQIREKRLFMRPTKAQTEVEFVVFFLDYVTKFRFDLIPNSVAESILSRISTIFKILKENDNRPLKSGIPDIEQDKIYSDLQNKIGEFFDEAINLILYLAYRSGELAIDIENVKSEIQQVQAELKSTDNLFEKKKGELDLIISDARVASAGAGVAVFTEDFNKEASNLRKQSKMWLITTGGFALLTVAMSVFFLFWVQDLKQAGEWGFLISLVSKVAIIVMLFSCTIWCSRIYRSLVHQAAVNRHRALSLMTFQAFAKSTSDPHVKDSVLMAATKSIFASVSTGFVDQVESQEQGVNFVKFGKSAGEKIVEEASQN